MPEPKSLENPANQVESFWKFYRQPRIQNQVLWQHHGPRREPSWCRKCQFGRLCQRRIFAWRKQSFHRGDCRRSPYQYQGRLVVRDSKIFQTVICILLDLHW